MSASNWLVELECLCIRYSELGGGHDLCDMSLDEKWGLYRFLQRYGLVNYGS